MFFDRRQRKRITRVKSLLFLILFIYVLTLPTWVQASSGYFPNYDPPQYKPKIDPLKYQPPQLQPPDYEKIHWEKSDESKSLEETVRNNLDPNASGDAEADKITSTWEELVKLIRGQEGGFFHEVMFVGAAMVGALSVMGVKSARASGGAPAKGILGRLFRLGRLMTGGANLLRGAWDLWSSSKAKVAGAALAVVVFSGAGVYWYQQSNHDSIEGYDAIAAKERYQYYLLSKMEDSATYIKLRYGDQPRGYYTDEQGILRDATGAIAWDFIGQYRERNPGLYEELIYPTLEHGERVEYWGRKLAEWAYANNMEVSDASKIVSFGPAEIGDEVLVNALLQYNVKVGRENADAPALGAGPLAAGVIKNTAKTTTKNFGTTTSTVQQEIKSGSSNIVKGTSELAEEGKLVRRILPDGSVVADVTSLPGKEGIVVTKRLTPDEMRQLTDEYGVEFALVYVRGNNKNGSGGTYKLFSGTYNRVSVPITKDSMLIYHTHPAGSPFSSAGDRRVLELLEQAGSPQRSSQIVPSGRTDVIRFYQDGTHK